IHRYVSDPDVFRPRRGAHRQHREYREEETDTGADADQARDASRNTPHHLLAASAERHTDTDLSRASRHGERNNGIETDAGQHEAEAAEAAEKRGDCFRGRLRLLEP